MNPCLQRAIVLAGAVIGAGFASGREVVSFFSNYGALSWGLILVTATVMMLLCGLCMRCSYQNGCCWCDLYTGRSSVVRMASGCTIILLQVMTGGAMLSAAGHIAALAFPFSGAYLTGVLGTLVIALAMGRCRFKPAAAVSCLLGILYVLAVLALLVFDGRDAVNMQKIETAPGPGSGLMGAVAYASMNLAISIGMICRCCDCTPRVSYRSAVVFGILLTVLLFLGNALFLKHPEVSEMVFPIVGLLSRFGRLGYIISLLMMYLAVLTTLSAGAVALQSGLEAHFPPGLSLLLSALLPLLASGAGFENLVDRWYTPAGILCFAVVFMPLGISAGFEQKKS